MIDPIANLKMENKFIDKTESRQAEAGDPGDPGVACLHGGGLSDITLASVPQPRHAVERGDRGVRDPDYDLHSLLPPEADRGLRGPLGDVDGGEHRGHAPNADILVSDKLSKTILKLDSSVIGRSPVPAERQTGSDIRRPKCCPTWLKINISDEVFDIESEGQQSSGSDRSNLISSFNRFCWQGQGGLKRAPVLPLHLLTNIKDVKSGPKRPPPVDDILHDSVCTRSSTKLTDISRTSR